MTFLLVSLSIDWDSLTFCLTVTPIGTPFLRQDLVGKTKFKNSQTSDSNRFGSSLTFIDVMSLVSILLVCWTKHSLKFVSFLSKFVWNLPLLFVIVDRRNWGDLVWSKQTVCESAFKIVKRSSYTYFGLIDSFVSLLAYSDSDRNA